MRPEQLVLVEETGPRPPWRGATAGARFPGWVEQVLAPTLRPGDVVVMDNLAAHKVAGVREAMQAAGAKLLYLPPHSPDLNPIELGLRQAEGAAAHGR